MKPGRLSTFRRNVLSTSSSSKSNFSKQGKQGVDATGTVEVRKGATAPIGSF
jgi:hypothetical protein